MEGIAAEHTANRFGVRGRIEDQIGLRFRLPILALKRVMKKVIENLAVQAGFFSVVMQKSSERILAGSWMTGHGGRRLYGGCFNILHPPFCVLRRPLGVPHAQG